MTTSIPGAPHLLLPPSDLALQRLPLATLRSGTTLFRSHAVGEGPIWFEPGPGRAAEYRFDVPAREYGVCHVGRSDMAAFVETFFRDLPVRVVSRANLEIRSISTLTLARRVRLVPLYGPSLAKLGATTAVAGAKLIVPPGLTGQPYAHSQTWSLALHEHPAEPDGVQYRSSHDDALSCVALFSDRASDAVEVTALGAPLSERKEFLAHAVRRYGVRLL